jgi:hypothetical protein
VRLFFLIRRGRFLLPAAPNPPDTIAALLPSRRERGHVRGEVTLDYPPGRFMQSNDWRLDLCAGKSPPLHE